MRTYTVNWTIDVEADSPREAAEMAFAVQRDEESIATVFEVQDVEALHAWDGAVSKCPPTYRFDLLNVPCVSCGRDDIELHVNGRCGECGHLEHDTRDER